MAIVNLKMSKNLIFGSLTAGDFTFEVYDFEDNVVATGTNDEKGLIEFTPIEFLEAGTFAFTAKEVSGPQGYILDERIYPITITVVDMEGELIVGVIYPDGVPGFLNLREGPCCGEVRFEDLTFDAPGTYEYTVKENSPSSGGWTTDNHEYKVIVEVVEDDFGNLIATINYPDGFPRFRNDYNNPEVKVTLSACKFSTGADLPEGKFIFGLYDEEGNLVSVATNGPAEICLQ